MKKLIILGLILFISGCEKKDTVLNIGKVNYDYKVDIVLNDNCSNEIKEYYKKEEKVYFVCLKEMYIYENEKITLKEFLNQENNLNTITDKMELERVSDDIAIYRDRFNKLSFSGFSAMNVKQ